MNAYVIKEVSSLNADRNATCTVNGSLTSAKRVATRQQAFQGTTMKVESTFGVLIAYKKGGKWIDAVSE